LKPEVRNNLVTMTTRGGQPMFSLPRKTDDNVRRTGEKFFRDPIKEEYGAGGAVGSAVEYIKILDSICADDGRLLMPKTIDEMFKPQLGDAAQEAFDEFSGRISAVGMFTALPLGSKPGHGVGVLVLSRDSRTGLRTGTMSWSGLMNLLWTIDRESGLSLIYASNIAPFGDFK